MAARVPDGAMIAVGVDGVGVAMETTRALIRRGVRDLHLVCVPMSGLQADLLIGAGCIATLETSAISFGEYGTPHRFHDALRSRAIAIKDATCPAIYAAVEAGRKGIPFIPLRGLIGSDLMVHRADWQVIDNPFATNDPIALLPAIRPDYALLHAPYADRNGNIFIGRRRDLALIAQAARHGALVTVEEVRDDLDLLASEETAAGALPAALCRGGSHRAARRLAARPRRSLRDRRGAFPPLRRDGPHRRWLRALSRRVRPSPPQRPPSEGDFPPGAADQRHCPVAGGCRSVAVGASSPIPAPARCSPVATSRDGTPPRRMFLTILGSARHNAMTSGGVELFDMAAQGRVDAFFLGGGQIDGDANINLVGAGDAYPRMAVRWPGSFGSAYLYFLVPRVILFREEHTRACHRAQGRFYFSARSAPRRRIPPRRADRPADQSVLVLVRRQRRRFTLETIHPGHSLEEVHDHTGFDFDIAPDLAGTAVPDAATLAAIRGPIAREIGEAYPRFVAQVFPDAA